MAVGTSPIKVFWRNDSSGSTFLFVNALITQCATTANPVPGTWLAAAGNGGVANNKFFINVKTAGLLPASFDTTGASGSGGIKAALLANADSVGYISPDFVAPVDTSGLVAANLQDSSTTSLAQNKWKFLAPTSKNAAALVKTAVAPLNTANSCQVGTGIGQSSDGVCSHNPLNWAPVFPAGAAKAYPIGGFTMIDTYSCYASGTVVDALTNQGKKTQGLLTYWTTNTTVGKHLGYNGFAAVSKAFTTAIKDLLFTDTATKIETAGSAGKCSTASGA